MELQVEAGGKWRNIPARAIVGAPGTPGGREVVGELVWVEMPEQANRVFKSGIRGKIVVLFGPLPNDVALHRKLVSLGPAAVIHVDDRLPFEWLKDDGVYPLWTKKYGMPTTVSIPYRLAWDLKKANASRAKLSVRLDQKQSESQNVVAEIPGKRSGLPLILVSAHHDTQCNNTGADDNASGVVALLELAAMFCASQPLRTVRFVSFGTEEQLSVGAAHYVKAHRRELSRVGMNLNMDGLSSVLGHNVVIRAGEDRLGKMAMSMLAKAGFDAKETVEAFPYGDHFPFTVYGIPAISISRPNMHYFMRWQHHSAHDNLNEVCVDEAAKAVRAVAAVIKTLAGKPRWPFGGGLSGEQKRQTLKFARDLYGMRV